MMNLVFSRVVVDSLAFYLGGGCEKHGVVHQMTASSSWP